jgi:hypothetical protein
VISAVKKSGTNELHGMASFCGRTRNMQHRRYFDCARTSDPSPGRPDGAPVFFMMPDANIKEPVYIPGLYDGRNKTFFFFGYQRLHEKKVAYNFNTPNTTVDFRNPAQFGKVSSDPTTASLGGQPLMNLTVMIQF